ncbi:mechanosensitive channel MscK [Actinobacillus minor]|uniref:mechanosensitive channel MscK n=1 Tax=Actinobacillus minor TaxID=51047 RepID=UPI0023F52076|nr:mechanosensitive channel MscK [Actinobacillus minor]MDD6911079.1 mechanosensitive channel MscK [Actinobacillus minor]MDY4714152.1 mechanosensitive channel MscK [Actinobacillus minor]
MIKTVLRYFVISLCLWQSHLSAAELPTEKAIQSQLTEANKLEQNDTTKALIKDLEDTQSLLSQIAQQNEDNNTLNDEINNAKKALSTSQANLDKLKNEQVPSADSLGKETLAKLQQSSSAIQSELDQVQADLSVINAKLVAQNAAPDKAQAVLTANAARKQAISSELSNANITDAHKNKLTTELALLDIQNTYNQNLLKGSEELSTLYNTQLDEKKQEQQNLQAELSALQQAINQKLVEDSKEKVAQATESLAQNLSSDQNPLIVKELDWNAKLSQELLNQTTKMSELSNDNLRIKSMLDNLQQTQRNIDEQISSLQGTLVLSRIINKQKQLLPQDQMIKGLADRISELRVNVFDMSEFKDTVSNPAAYIAKLESSNKTQFTEKEKNQLTEVLQARAQTLSELIKSLNNQLNLAINIELSQKQVQTISDELQQKLQQQSFWVKSNSPIDLAWFTKFPLSAGLQLEDIAKQFDFSNWRDNALPAGVLIALLTLMTIMILRQKESIKHRLNQISNSMKAITTDSQWNTPYAIFLTIILCLPSTFMFLMAFILVTYICFQNPLTIWPWGLKMAGYWLYFAFMMAMLRPNGIGYRHFDMPQKSNMLFLHILKRSVWVIGLLLNTSIFANSEMGVAYDVIGQTMTIMVLVVTVFIIAPGFRKAISTYQNTVEQDKSPRHILLTLVRIVLLLAPIALIGLIVMGYYYTSLVIIEHLISTYFAVTTWIIVRNVFYRMFTVSARRLAYRRLQEKREQLMAKRANETVNNATEDDIPLEIKQDAIAVSEVKNQMLKITDFVLWVGLFALLYWVWSDLITVAYYLKGVTLWQQSTTTENGVVMESITLLNLLVAVIIVVVTYVLIRNLSGLLETFVFSNLKLSQGTPYTITTLLTYLLVVLGASLAFSMLGMSWSKLQWLFTALSVGLGFGMQEIFGNFVSGIIILFERPVRVGDMVTIGNFNGTVSKIRIRATTLIDNDKKEVIVPNKAFITERVVNWALTNSMTRLVISIGVAYGSDLDLVKKLLLQAAEENDAVLRDPAPAAYFLSFGASTLDHELRVYVGQLSDRTRTIDTLNRRINQLFAENNIDIAFNQLDIFIKNQSTNEEVKWSSEQLDVKR